jgi:hypothetical protein
VKPEPSYSNKKNENLFKTLMTNQWRSKLMEGSNSLMGSSINHDDSEEETEKEKPMTAE